MEIDWSAEERRPILRMLTPADLLSLGNGWLGLLAIITASTGQFRASFTFIVLAVLFDGFDGAVARLGYGAGRLGGKLDTLSDLVSFVIAPSVLFWNYYGAQPWLGLGFMDRLGALLLAVAVIAVYFGAGILRLARFDYLKGGERHDYFIGVTTPGAATVLASVVLLGLAPAPALVTIALVGVLMTSRVRLPKLRGAMAPAGGFVLLAAATLGDAWNGLGPILLLAFFFAYLVLGPGYVRRHERDDEEPQPLY